MNFKTPALLLNMIIAACTGEMFSAAASRNRYVVVYPTDNDPFADIAAIDAANAQTIMHTATQDFAVADLTTEEAQQLQQQIQNVSGVVVLDEPIQLMAEPDYGTMTGEITEYLNDAPSCKAEVNGVDIIVIDTVIYKDIAEFSNTNIEYGPIYVNKQPCNGHGTKVASIMVGKTAGIAPKGDRKIYNIGIFDCNGFGFVSSLIGSFSNAIDYAAENKQRGRRSLVNLSGVSNANFAIDKAAEEVVKAGIPFIGAAGNDADNACNRRSPPRARGVIAVGATKNPGDVLADFSNWGYLGECVDLYLPGYVTVFDVNSGKKIISSGSSYSAPIATIMCAIRMYFNRAATPVQLQQWLVSKTITVTPPADAAFTSPIPVMLANNACPNLQLINDFTTSKRHTRKFTAWHQAGADNNFCVQFDLTSKKSAALIGLRNNNTQAGAELRLTIGKQLVFSQQGHTLNSSIPTEQLLSKKNAVKIKIEQNANRDILLSYTSGLEQKYLLSADIADEINEVAFSGLDKGVTYKNVMQCG